jgi:hypothetical protein
MAEKGLKESTTKSWDRDVLNSGYSIQVKARRTEKWNWDLLLEDLYQ